MASWIKINPSNSVHVYLVKFLTTRNFRRDWAILPFDGKNSEQGGISSLVSRSPSQLEYFCTCFDISIMNLVYTFGSWQDINTEFNRNRVSLVYVTAQK